MAVSLDVQCSPVVTRSELFVNRTCQMHHQPTDYVRAAWAVIRRDPFMVGVRIGGNIGVGVMQFTTYFFVGLAFILVAFGDALGAPVPAPRLMALGAAGLWLTAFVGGFLVDAAIAAGIWNVAAEAARGDAVRPISTFITGAKEWFSTAFLQLVFMRVVEGFLLATFGVVLISTTTAGRLIATVTGEEIVAPALAWGLMLSLFSVFALVTRLSAAFMAPALFIEGATFGAAMERAARCVLSAIVPIYRIFVNAAVVLLVPLFMYWAAIMVQNISLEVPGMEPIGALVRITGEIVLMLGMALFFIVTQVAFFGFYAVHRGHAEGPPSAASVGLDPSKTRWFTGSKHLNRPPALADLLPDDLPNVVSLEEILGPVPDRPAPEERDVASEDQALNDRDSVESAPSEEAAFEFDALLKPRQDEDDDDVPPK